MRQYAALFLPIPDSIIAVVLLISGNFPPDCPKPLNEFLILFQIQGCFPVVAALLCLRVDPYFFDACFLLDCHQRVAGFRNVTILQFEPLYNENGVFGIFLS
jgi:hypothetical protein